MLGFRSLRMPAVPDPGAPDAEYRRFWEESRVWWDSWAANFGRSMVLLLVAFLAAVIILIALG